MADSSCSAKLKIHNFDRVPVGARKVHQTSFAEKVQSPAVLQHIRPYAGARLLDGLRQAVQIRFADFHVEVPAFPSSTPSFIFSKCSLRITFVLR